ERGPMPGSLASAAVRATMGSGSIRAKAEGRIKNAEMKWRAARKIFSSFCLLHFPFTFPAG
ncbi:MAG: hypothetical protein WCK57_13410, partial [Verrucomicrobiae bacterium]